MLLPKTLLLSSIRQHRCSRSYTSLILPQRSHFSTSESATTYQYLRLENEGSVGRIIISRKEVHNAFNEDLIAELTRAFQQLPTQTRALVLTGEGASFSAGADLNWMKKMAKYSREQNEEDSHRLFDMFHAIKQCPVPVIARVNGAALGGGSGLVAACDLAFALDAAKFGFTEVKLGLLPAVISPFVLAKIGYTHGSRYFLTGEKFNAAEAKRIGLINDTFATEQQLDETITAICKEIAQNGPAAVGNCKKLLHSVHFENSDFAKDRTKMFVASQIAQARVSPEGQEGLTAFLEKKKPGWIKSS